MDRGNSYGYLMDKKPQNIHKISISMLVVKIVFVTTPTHFCPCTVSDGEFVMTMTWWRSQSQMKMIWGSSCTQCSATSFLKSTSTLVLWWRLLWLAADCVLFNVKFESVMIDTRFYDFLIKGKANIALQNEVYSFLKWITMLSRRPCWSWPT